MLPYCMDFFFTPMAFLPEPYQLLLTECRQQAVTLVAVSKTKPISDIEEAYALGQRDFGENYVQELADKQARLPQDIRWHFIGHLQKNKVKYIAPFVHLIHGVDSLGLLQEIQKQGKKLNRRIDCLLQRHIAREETKFGLDETELLEILDQLNQYPEAYASVQIRGLMGMASFTNNQQQIRSEFESLSQEFHKIKTGLLPGHDFSILSMGMSADYPIAIDCGSTLIRVGSKLFGERAYPNRNS